MERESERERERERVRERERERERERDEDCLVAQSNSIRGFVRPLVCPFVAPSVRLLVHHAFLKNIENR